MKKLISIFVAVLMCLGTLGAAAQATPSRQVHSGSCGENVSWTLDTESGVFEVTGSGDMYDFSDDDPSPWNSLKNSIKSVKINNGVTSVGDNTFDYCFFLESVTIGNDVARIGEYAFYNCYVLSSVTIGNSVDRIDDYAFMACEGLSSVVFLGAPPSEVGEWVFDFCASDFCILYNSAYSAEWAPNGETTWNEYPIAPCEIEAEPGDADGSGAIDTTDALLVLRCALGISGDPEEMIAICDMDGNGVIDTTDALLILRMALGIS
ncbi:MAG: leucine-rich repeat protein [Clostridia bacterium]|nr:leucine-rich repeat protein [Clostridia bacterium]